MRILLLIAAVILLFLIVRNLILRPTQQDKQNTHTLTGKMVRCAQCDLHLPVTEAIEKNQQYFCSEKHYVDWKNSQSS